MYKKKLLQSLSLSMAIIFILISGATILYEFSHLEKHIQDKALTTSKLLTKQYLNKKMSMMQQQTSLDTNDFFKDSKFHLFTLHDVNQTPVISYKSKEFHLIKNNINEHEHFLEIHEEKKFRISLIHDHINSEYYIESVLEWTFDNGQKGELHTFYNGTREVYDIYTEWAIEVVKIALVCLLIFLSMYPVILLLQKDLIRKNSLISQTNIEILKILGNAIAQRDSDTNTHNYRVSLYSVYLAEALMLSDIEIQHIIQGAFLHDIGKIGISDNILLKQGKLSIDEYEKMKEHVIKGAHIVRDCQLLKPAADIILYHHEKYDGTGYYKGLSKTDIPVSARIFSIVDVFDALTSVRPYKEAFDFNEAKNIMIKESGKHFDPAILELFFKIVPKLYEIIHKNNTEEHLSQLLEEKIVKYY